MLTAANNEMLTRVGPGTPMGNLMREYWIPACLSSELKADGEPMRLLLLDEPAAGLRLAEKQRLATLLRQLRAEGMGVLLVEHDMDFVMQLADRVVVMDFGQKIAEGPPERVQSDPAVQEAYLGGVA